MKTSLTSKLFYTSPCRIWEGDACFNKHLLDMVSDVNTYNLQQPQHVNGKCELWIAGTDIQMTACGQESGFLVRRGQST